MNKLVCKNICLKHHTNSFSSDRAFIKAFMMTFKSFTTVDTLFDLLVQRFRIQPPPDLNPKELDNWTTLKQRVIQMRSISHLYISSILSAHCS